MPKRMVDGEALWTSSKLKKVFPVEWRAHYANWLPLAEANGVFEVDFDIIRARVYPILLPYFQPEDVGKLFNEFVRVGLVKTWFDEEEKQWGFFVGMEKSGRLPVEKHLKRYKNLPPGPPDMGEPDNKVYFIQASESGLIKIGVANDPSRRLASLQSAHAEDLKLVNVTNGGFRKEKELHERFKELRKEREWFLPEEPLLTYICALPDYPGFSRINPRGFGLVCSGLERVGSGLGAPSSTTYSEK